MTPKQDPIRLVALAGFVVYLVTAISNVGIVALDDYTGIMAKVLPAQAHSAAEIVAKASYRTPVPILIHLELTSTAAALGLSHPVTQLRFDQAMVATLTFWLCWWSGTSAFGAYKATDRNRHQLVFTALLGFYCIAPLFLTRPMVETLSAPFLAAGTALLCRYQASLRREPLVLSVAAFALAAVIRPQVGIVVLAVPLVIGLLSRWRDLWWFAASGAVAFVAAGLLDQSLRGSFHESLRAYIRFNLTNTYDFGSSPWYVFTLVLIGATLPPVFFSRYRGVPWRDRYLPLLPALLVFLVFVAAHSLVPHKEERFLIPILPVFLLSLTPLATWLIDHGPRWRPILFAVVNTVLLVLVILNPPQATAMALARYVDRHPSVETVILASPATFLPAVFVTRAVRVEAGARLPEDCSTAVAVLALGPEGARLAAHPGLVRTARFEPGPLERLIVAINPRHNARRGPVELYTAANCGEKETGNGERETGNGA